MLYISVYFYAIHATEPEATTTICYVSTRLLVYILLVYILLVYIQPMIQLVTLMNTVHGHCVD